MRAILASGDSKLSRAPGGARGVLAPLVDRPFLQHVIESILGHGINEIDFVLTPADKAARGLLGDGTRWGARFSYHEAQGQILDGIREVAARNPDEHFLLAQSDLLPLIPADPKPGVPTLYCWREKKLNWSGWGVVRTADVLSLPPGIEDSQLFDALLANGGMPCQEGPKALSVRSYEELVDANRRVLGREFPGLLMGGREIQPGVWVARNVKIHPTAKLRSPAYVGANSTVAAMVEVGPSVSIGESCIIERDTLVADSVIFSGSYVGQHLALRGVVVDHSRLVNTRWHAEIEGVDELLMGSVTGPALASQLQQYGERFAALIALVLCFPVLLVLYLFSLLGWLPALKREDMLVTPTVADSYRWRMFSLWSFGERQTPVTTVGWWRDLLFCFLPALVPMAAGHMKFVGHKARNKEDSVMATMIHDVGFLYAHTGFLQQSLFDCGGPENCGPVEDGKTLTLVPRYVKALMGMSSTASFTEDRHAQAAAVGGSRHEN